ncbi:hypothetical protein Bca52824_089619 [Brassica carinata]|uniref:NB-ARC domain-containing protein n=1 Tax=Brassica carinata TaxID=52824 RepID=A0A8X7TQN3_BRACI|nr:hypothetical protein Bca52824_089619 [Brassica carinata]
MLDELRIHIWGFLTGYEGVNHVPNWNLQYDGGVKTKKLVILDDVWTREALDHLTSNLPGCTTLVKSVPPGFDKDLVKKVAGECKGLPLVFKVTGASLKDRPEQYWQGALLRLSRGEPTDETHETRLGSLYASYYDVFVTHHDVLRKGNGRHALV